MPSAELLEADVDRRSVYALLTFFFLCLVLFSATIIALVFRAYEANEEAMRNGYEQKIVEGRAVWVKQSDDSDAVP